MTKEKLQQLAHLIAGLLTISYGFESFEKGDLIRAAIFLGSAIVFMLIAGLHKTLLKKFMQGDVAFFLLEALAIFYSGYHYKMIGKKYFYFLFLVIGILYILFAFFSMNLEDRPNKRNSGRRSKRKRSKPRTIKTEEFLRAGNSNQPNE